MSEIDWERLWTRAAEGFTLGTGSLHGPDHWQRVERNALKIGVESGADLVVVRLFAILHDSQRWNEGHDPDHGFRASQFAALLRGDLFDIEDDRAELLSVACVWHDKGRTSDDPTIGCCWDADRLDLTRVGVRPIARLMSTKAGKRFAMS